MKLQSSLITVFLLATQLAPFGAWAQLFTKVTTGPLTTTPSGSRSCNFLDFNNDDFQDILITNGKAGGENNMLYRNERNGTFTLLSDPVCQDSSPSDGATCADYDNDGLIDIFVSNWYGVDNLLYHNNLGTGFTLMDTSILSNDGGYSETAAWGDMDNDGLVDLYVANSAGTHRNFLYHNQGAGTFQKVSGIIPILDAFKSRCVNWIDIDFDGDQDLFVANENNQRNNLYRNDGPLTFTKITTDITTTATFTSHSSSWADYDNDGDFDLMVANYNQASQLYRNDGSGNFTEVSNPWGSDIGCSFSSSFGDYDNDGDLDLFVTNGYCTPFTHNFLYDNNGNGTFTRNLTEPMAIDSGSSYGCAWGDYDNDGFLDLVVANWKDETQPNSLYHNNGNTNHWLQLKLQGTTSNRSAIGTKVRCKSLLHGTPTWQLREVTAQSGYCSQNSLIIHFGLADATQIDSLQVLWPSGITQTFTNLTPSQFYTLLENGTLGVVSTTTPSKTTLSIFPNPSPGHFTLQLPATTSPLDLQVLDLIGQTVHTQSIPASTTRIPLSLHLPDGTYLLHISRDGQPLNHQKLIIQH